MKAIYKYLFISMVTALAGGFLAGCSDDDDSEVKLPEEFTMDVNSVNVLWDETEAVVDFGANEAWSAVCSETWAQIDPTKGDAGDYRLFLVMKRNYNLLPRTAEITVKCGEVSKSIIVVQSGCDDKSQVTTINTALETGPVAYSTGELSLSEYAYEIENNLGLTMEQFKKAVEDETLELCIVDKKTDTWKSAAYTADGLGYWLDSDMEVTNWDAAGYPANALFIETDGDVVHIGRADGMMDEVSFDLSFVYRLKNEPGKYLRFNVEVTCPVYTAEVGIEMEENVINAKVEIVGEYNATLLPYDGIMETLSEYLSVGTVEDFVKGIQNGDIFMYMVDSATGDWLTEAKYTAGGVAGYWLGENLTPTTWNPEGYPAITLFIETYDADGIGIGSAPGVESGMAFDVSFVYAKSPQKYVRVNLHAYEH